MTYQELLRNKNKIEKRAHILKSAIAGKGKIISFLTKKLKDTLYYPGRDAFKQGLNGFAGNHENTILGHYIKQKVERMPSTALLKKDLQSFIDRQNRSLDWDFWKGADRFTSAIQNQSEAIPRLLQRLSRRPMWNNRETLRPIIENFRSHLNALGQAQRIKWPNYNADQYALYRLRHLGKWW